MSEKALVLASGLFATPNAKTAHGLVRGPSRFPVAALIDPDFAGRDAGEVLDGKPRGIPVFASVAAALAELSPRPSHAIVGVATVGGVLPPAIRRDLVAAAAAGLSLVSGLHRLLADDPELAALAALHGGAIVDIRKPRPASELAFWTGEILKLATPRFAVLGTDCALGKRTTCGLLLAECRARGREAEMIYTGQTGWLQGYRYGFILDSTLNDFVSGELEKAILSCARERNPQLILIEGQSGLRNPSGPCGAEILVSGAVQGVILVHAPGRHHYEVFEDLGGEEGALADGAQLRLPSAAAEIALIAHYGKKVLGLALNPEGLEPAAARLSRDLLAAELGIPVVLPLEDGVGQLVDALEAELAAAPRRAS